MKLTLGFLTVCTLVVVGAPWALGAPPPALFFDDFFYYLVVADRFLEVGSLEFFPGVPTNGFHPLWMVFLVALRSVASNDLVFFASLGGVILLGMGATWLLLRRFLLELTGDSASATAGLLVAAPGLLLMGPGGLEIVLTLPLLGVLLLQLWSRPLHERTAQGQMGLGLLAAAAILARLDAILLLAPLLLTALLESRRSWRQVLSSALALGAGLLPVGAYMVWSWVHSETWLPISGVAKQLKPSPLPGLTPLTELWNLAPGVRPFFTLSVLAWLGGWASLLSPMGRERPRRGLLLALFASPVLFFGVQCMRTDWPLWFWYLYPWVWVGACGAACAVRAWGSRVPVRLAWAGAVVLAAVSLPAPLHTFTNPGDNWIYDIDRAVAEHIEGAPGRYSMGDAAGTLAFLTDHPVLQTEGLVMDRAFVGRIAGEHDLVEVLQDYGIDVHITLRAVQQGDCWEVTEPAMAGPSSPRMRGRFCGEPRFVVRAAGITALGFAVPERAG